MSPRWNPNRDEPTFTMAEVREIIFTWLDQLAVLPDEHSLAHIGAVASDLKLAADKSSYLGRRFYGENQRTEPCPKHKGVWSGLPGWKDCDYGCNYTGWLPRSVSAGVRSIAEDALLWQKPSNEEGDRRESVEGGVTAGATGPSILPSTPTQDAPRCPTCGAPWEYPAWNHQDNTQCPDRFHAMREVTPNER